MGSSFPYTEDGCPWGVSGMVQARQTGVLCVWAEAVCFLSHMNLSFLQHCATHRPHLKVPGMGELGSSASMREKSVGMKAVSHGQGWRLCFFLSRQKGRRCGALFRRSAGTSSPLLPSSLTTLLASLANRDDMFLEGPRGQVSYKALGALVRSLS